MYGYIIFKKLIISLNAFVRIKSSRASFIVVRKKKYRLDGITYDVLC